MKKAHTEQHFTFEQEQEQLGRESLCEGGLGSLGSFILNLEGFSFFCCFSSTEIRQSI